MADRHITQTEITAYDFLLKFTIWNIYENRRFYCDVTYGRLKGAKRL